jgi:enamine deaminase RidA (YjgF/YER057c/UK114 family)
VSILQYLRTGALCALLTPALAFAADQPTVNEKFADLEPAIQMLRQEVGKDRRDIVKANMLLTNSEAAMFWPIYDEYRGEMNKVGDRRVKLISDYAASRDSMSEDEGARLLKERMDIDKQRNDVREDYVKKFNKKLSARTTARFFQIDNKLDAAVEAALAARIPLIY